MRYAKVHYYRWTQQAKECYERGCICKGCPIKEILENECYMKTAVLELVKKYGRPPKTIKSKKHAYRK